MNDQFDRNVAKLGPTPPRTNPPGSVQARALRLHFCAYLFVLAGL
jgi:hypothetical protein